MRYGSASFWTGSSASAAKSRRRDACIATRRKNLEKQQEALNARMQVMEARYLKQFTALDSMLSQLQSTSTYLTQQLDSLSNLASRKN